jgi:16S rRNA (uracil1498-N3)-methyltransferase
MVTTAEVAALLGEADLAVVLHEGAGAALSSLSLDGVASIVVVVGPEGGISEEELVALGAGHVVRMGESVLRTSTAGLAAVAALLSRTTRWA